MDAISCCQPCPTTTPVNIPGVEGPSGSSGQNAYTTLTQPFTIPTVGNTSTAFVASSQWMTIGQKVFSGDGTHKGTFEVMSPIADSTSVPLKFMGYTGDSVAGSVIASGSGVSPAGVEVPVATLLPTLSSYAVAGAQALTITPAQALSSQIVLGVTGHHVIHATVRLDYVGATFAANRTITLQLRRTNNTPNYLTNAVCNFLTQIITTQTYTAYEAVMPVIDYSGAAGDVIQVYASIDVVPSAGAANIVECSLFALPIF